MPFHFFLLTAVLRTSQRLCSQAADLTARCLVIRQKLAVLLGKLKIIQHEHSDSPRSPIFTSTRAKVKNKPAPFARIVRRERRWDTLCFRRRRCRRSLSCHHLFLTLSISAPCRADLATIAPSDKLSKRPLKSVIR